MTTGRLIAVVGPSGVGKDSLMAGLKAARPELRLVRRVITRAATLGGEVFDSVTRETFAAMVESGAFCLHWSAHDLSYGIPADVLRDVESGVDCLANLSRDALVQAEAVFPRLTVLNVTASPQALAGRLTGRGRETEAEISRRLARAAKPLPPGLDLHQIDNDGPLCDAVAAALDALQPARA
jgi:ribose 1,5-bisphosphokinase